MILLQRSPGLMSWEHERDLSLSTLRSALTKTKGLTTRTIMIYSAWELLTLGDEQWCWVKVHLPTQLWSCDCGNSSEPNLSLPIMASSTLLDSILGSEPSSSGSIPCSPATASTNDQETTA